MYERGVEDFFDHVLPAQSWEMAVESELPAKIGRCCKNFAGRNFALEQNPPERIFYVHFTHHLRILLLSQNCGQPSFLYFFNTLEPL